jgi:hypothetical protein
MRKWHGRMWGVFWSRPNLSNSSDLARPRANGKSPLSSQAVRHAAWSLSMFSRRATNSSAGKQSILPIIFPIGVRRLEILHLGVFTISLFGVQEAGSNTSGITSPGHGLLCQHQEADPARWASSLRVRPREFPSATPPAKHDRSSDRRLGAAISHVGSSKTKSTCSPPHLASAITPHHWMLLTEADGSSFTWRQTDLALT